MGKGVGLLAAMVVGFGALFLGAWKYDTSHTDAEVVTAESAINADLEAHLPKGSSDDDVVKVLAAHGISGHYYLNMHSPQSSFDGASGMDAFATPAFGNAIHECRLYYTFYFDEAERLTSYHDDALCKSTLMNADHHDPGQPMRPGVDQAPKPVQHP
jgi:hypothetical protein